MPPIGAGATLGIHVGNAVPLHLHRHDNVIQRLLARDDLIACLIPDGIHLPPFVLKNYFRAKPNGCRFLHDRLYGGRRISPWTVFDWPLRR